MSQRVVAFTGISGVGKTTFLRKFAELMEFQHVTGGSLIAAARNASRDGRDTIRHADLDENQSLLIDGFALARDTNAQLIIMDGHVVIDDGEGLTKIPSDVFKALDVMAMVHLEACPARIAKNRLKDSSRSRPRYDTETLGHHQDISRVHAHSIAGRLGIGFHTVTHEDVKHMVMLLDSKG